MKRNLILNPGSTSTKIGLFDGTAPIFVETIRHSREELAKVGSDLQRQKKFRTKELEQVLTEKGIAVEDLTGVISIGGLIRPCAAGVYTINKDMLNDLTANKYHFHAGNLGALIAYDLAQRLDMDAYAADAINTNEMQKKAVLSGMPELDRHMVAHTLNERGTACVEADRIGKAYEDCCFVVVHMGGGITVTAHRKGKMVDGNAPRGEGTFCMDRTGGLNAYALAKLCFSGKYTQEEMLRKISGEGGVAAYLGTTDFREVEQRAVSGEERALQVFESMAYQISKEIGAMCVALGGTVDAIILTGGIAYSQAFVEEIKKQVSFLGRVAVYPGELEMETLARYLHEVQNQTRRPLTYYSEG